MLHEGDVLKNRYKIQGLIGRGGMSSVYMSVDTQLSNKIWAVKEVSRNAHDAVGRPIEQSLVTEVELLAKLDHPSIVDIVDIIKTNEYIYVVMDYVEGQSLDKVVREQGPQSEEDVQNWMIQICDALSYLHSQDPPIIYRDMKPGNIMLRPDGYIKLIDLGVAREYKDSSQKDTIAFGTEGYAPPEQYGKAQTDARADIYALGATMWHLLCGEAPSEYPLPDVRTRNNQVGEGFSTVIVPKCTQLDRELRYQDCEELVSDLEVYEELTQEFRNQQKRKVKISASFAGSGVLCAIIGVILIFVGIFVTANECKSLIQNGRNNTVLSEQRDFYIKAVEKRHNVNSAEAYEALLDFYTDYDDPGDGGTITTSAESNKVITPVELKSFNDAYKKGGNAGTPSEAYSIGLKIWENFGSTSTDKSTPTDDALQEAKGYFEKAADSSDITEKNNSELLLKLAELSKVGNDMAADATPQEEFNKLKEINKSVSSVNHQMIRLAAYDMIGNKLRHNISSYKDANVSESEVKSLYTDYRNGIDSININTPERWAQLARDAKSTAGQTESIIKSTYAAR